MEGVAVLNGAQQPELAAKLAQYLQSPTVQRAIPTSMWVYPAVKNTPLAGVMAHASVPKVHFAPNVQRAHANRKAWFTKWMCPCTPFAPCQRWARPYSFIHN